MSSGPRDQIKLRLGMCVAFFLQSTFSSCPLLFTDRHSRWVGPQAKELRPRLVIFLIQNGCLVLQIGGDFIRSAPSSAFSWSLGFGELCVILERRALSTHPKKKKKKRSPLSFGFDHSFSAYPFSIDYEHIMLIATVVVNKAR